MSGERTTSLVPERDPALSIQLLPGRKRKALCETRGNVTRPLAYFVDDEAVEAFLHYKPRFDDGQAN